MKIEKVTIVQKLVDQLKEILEVDVIDVSANLADYELWDSLSALTLIAFLEEEYMFPIEASELLEFATIQDLIDALDRRQTEKG